jgi:hypothetical protein
MQQNADFNQETRAKAKRSLMCNERRDSRKIYICTVANLAIKSRITRPQNNN